ncbi:hypothetical protein [Neptunicella sp. SCSIO 80796]|uniref:hypothetical protein n=1 Tax=Neptunicella plasticusilytica TaxID=3117012 RepID=UPI003A4D9D6D
MKNKGLTLLETLALYVGLDSKTKFHTKKYWVQFLSWPPNSFAVSAAILSETGAYLKLISPTTSNCSVSSIYANGVEGRTLQNLAIAWKANIGKQENALDESICECAFSELNIESIILDKKIVPIPIRNLISSIFTSENFSKTMADLSNDDEFISKVLFLLSVSDECCAGFGVDSANTNEVASKCDEVVLTLVDIMLRTTSRRSLSTICPSRVSVLPKSLTPTLGISLHSLSHHLAFISGEVTAFWNDIGIDSASPDHNSKSHLNILIIPYPYNVHSNQFELKENAPHTPVGAKYFKYTPQPDIEFLIKVTKSLLIKAQAASNFVDIIVFPEATFRTDSIQSYLRQLNDALEFMNIPHKPVVIAGVIDKPITIQNNSSKNIPRNFEERNCSVLVPPHRYENHGIMSKSFSLDGIGYEQVKHHRWQLDQDQVRTYDLGLELGGAPNDLLWEGISLEDRRVVFTQWENWFSVCTLICEDLARQEPVSRAIRAVGPNLIVALLFDGPQKKFRWPGRHATTLSEEPGSSVLTVTSLGMSKRSIPKISGFVLDEITSRTIALWRDKLEGEKELVLDDGSHAIILELKSNFCEQISADCRSDNGGSVFLTYKRHFSLTAESEGTIL